MIEIDAVIMAAGLSTRMGENKLLLRLGETTLLEQFLTGLPFPLFQRVVLVYSDDEIGKISRSFPVTLRRNPAPENGKSGTIRIGLADCTADGLMFFTADQPLLTGRTIETLTEEFRKSPDTIILPVCEERSCNPVLFPHRFHGELAGLKDDEGGRILLQKHPEAVRKVPCPDRLEFMDIDTPEAYQKLRTLWKQRTLS